MFVMGASRVGKSQLINVLFNRDLVETSDSLDPCTRTIQCYVLEDNQQQTPGINPFRINFYDTPGIESWNDQHNPKIMLKFIEETDPVCLIYCASPGSLVDLKQFRLILEFCKEKQIFFALVCTNMWTGSIRNDVHKVIIFGNGALCTMVNSKECYYPNISPISLPVQGIDELMHCIVEALDSDKLLGLCKAVLNRRTLKEKIIQKIGFPFSTYWTSS